MADEWVWTKCSMREVLACVLKVSDRRPGCWRLKSDEISALAVMVLWGADDIRLTFVISVIS